MSVGCSSCARARATPVRCWLHAPACALNAMRRRRRYRRRLVVCVAYVAAAARRRRRRISYPRWRAWPPLSVSVPPILADWLIQRTAQLLKPLPPPLLLLLLATIRGSLVHGCSCYGCVDCGRWSDRTYRRTAAYRRQLHAAAGRTRAAQTATVRRQEPLHLRRITAP